MRRVAVILVVVAVCALSGIGHAADLQAGWYAKLGGVALHGVVPGQGTFTIGWNFVGGLGSYGPFLVTGFGTRVPQCMVSVPEDVANVAAGTSVYLWGEPDSPVTGPVTELAVYWDSDYQASEMRVELFKYSASDGFVFLWAQSESGPSLHWDNVLQPGQWIEVGSVPVFRVTTIVPEPTSLAVFSIGCVMLAKRRRHIR